MALGEIVSQLNVATRRGEIRISVDLDGIVQVEDALTVRAVQNVKSTKEGVGEFQVISLVHWTTSDHLEMAVNGNSIGGKLIPHCWWDPFAPPRLNLYVFDHGRTSGRTSPDECDPHVLVTAHSPGDSKNERYVLTKHPLLEPAAAPRS